ncbi:MAG: FAD-binding oxidoreductase [Alphaproteobacteria bacterium]|nr:FAD-binding oxidoreductase [Alphaproteobacteria bacterium]MDE2112513.1 FAD-binding oxidoreductase [Alphaproteobacteria bacterium]MDE2495901.1 FAD-binding oxidoreductase [Alphaproteobacteria bacterium]
MSDLIKSLQQRLGDGAVLEGVEARQSAFGWGRLGKPFAVVRPKSTAEVSAVLKMCHDAGQAVVPWGGRTGLVEGAYAEDAVALSLERMNRIVEIDAAGATMTVEAGCILQQVCETADGNDMFFPLDLGARGSATIGGNISTNAGGNRVIRYGMMRELVLGLEAVLADGTVVSSLNRLIKNNAGYDLKQMFIGSEGTLGVVTQAVLRLRPKPVSQNVAMLAVGSFEMLPRVLRSVERGLGGTLSAFEVMWEDFYRLVTTPPAQGTAPIPHGHPYYVLLEAMGGDQSEDSARFERVLAAELESGQVADAVIAKSKAECHRLWALRDDVAQVVRTAPFFTFDVSLQISEMDEYVREVRQALLSRWPAATLMVFGHLGDGNLHLIPGVGDGSHEARTAVESIVYDPLRVRRGSVSAEHGIGLEKRPYLPISRNVQEIALMRTVKQALDPRNILNPGKILG